MLSESALVKINLGLHIIRRRTNGYHDLVTVFNPIRWDDRITVNPAEKISMTCTDTILSSGEDNLAVCGYSTFWDSASKLLHLYWGCFFAITEIKYRQTRR